MLEVDPWRVVRAPAYWSDAGGAYWEGLYGAWLVVVEG